jgi:hypothetical protein
MARLVGMCAWEAGMVTSFTRHYVYVKSVCL